MSEPMGPLEVARRRALLTEEELAARSGVSVVTIRKAQSGGSVRLSSRRKIMDGLGLPREDHEKYFGPVDPAAAGEDAA